MRDRPPYRPVPYDVEQVLRALPPGQRAVLFALPFVCNWEPSKVPVNGVTVEVSRGEALVSNRGLAAQLRLGPVGKGEQLVRRALASGVRLGLISTRPATRKGDAPHDAPSHAPPDAPRNSPPTIVRWLSHRDFLWSAARDDSPRDAPPDAPRDAQGDPIPTGHQDTRHKISNTARSAQPHRKPRRGESDPRHHAFTEAWFTAYAEACNGERPVHDGSDAKALERFLAAQPGVTIDEWVARGRRSISARFHACHRVRELCSKWGHHGGTPMARTNGHAGKDRTAEAIATACPRLAAIIRDEIERAFDTYQRRTVDEDIATLLGEEANDGTLHLTARDEGHALWVREHRVERWTSLVGPIEVHP